MTPTLRELFAFNDWANALLLGVAATLPDEALDAPRLGSRGRVRDTLHHVWAAERIWLDRWAGVERPLFVEPEPGLPVAALAERFRATAAERDARLGALDDAGERRALSYVDRRGRTWTYALRDMMLHVVNHGLHHRGVVAAALHAATGKPLYVDYVFFRVARSTVGHPAEVAAWIRAQGLEEAREEPWPAATLDLALVREWWRYADWARDRVHAAARALPDEALDRPTGLALGTVRRTLVHVRNAEEWWYGNWTGKPAAFDSLPPGSAPLAELEARFAETAARREAFLDALRPGELERPVGFEPAPGLPIRVRLGESLVQLCGHGTHHRGQATLFLRALGQEPPPLDYLDRVDELARA